MHVSAGTIEPSNLSDERGLKGEQSEDLFLINSISISTEFLIL